LRQRVLDELLVEATCGVLEGERARLIRWPSPRALRKEMPALDLHDSLADRAKHRALDGVLELPDVARPLCRLDRPHGVARQGAQTVPLAAARLGAERGGHLGDVLAPFGQRRHADGDDVEPSSPCPRPPRASRTRSSIRWSTPAPPTPSMTTCASRTRRSSARSTRAGS